jgi:hypothetical protein
MLAAFVAAVKDVRPAIEAATEDDLAVTWTHRSGDKVFFAPRGGVPLVRRQSPYPRG